MKKIALFGPYPPPYGGRSIHIKRLAKKLIQDNKLVHIYYNGKVKNLNQFKIRKVKSILFYIFKEKYDIFHFHDRNFKLISLIIFISRFFRLKSKTVLSYHSFRDEPSEYNYVEKILFRYSIKRIDQFVCVGPNEYSKLCKYVDSNKIETIQSYIQPSEEEGEFAAFPIKLQEYVQKSEFLITANGNIRFHNNEDLYGLDMLIELMNRIVNHNKYNVQLLIAVLESHKQTEKETNYYKELKTRIKNYSLENFIYLYEVNNTELYPLLKRSNLFIRPTNTDSYGVSVAEAVFASIPAIASDVCERPLGATLFLSRNEESLYTQFCEVFNNYPYYLKRAKGINQSDYFVNMNNLYEKLFNI